MERPVVRSAVGGPSRAMVWVALMATILNGLSGISHGHRRASAPRVVKVKVRPSGRSDLGVPRFTKPTAVTNPLFPVSKLVQVIQLGAEGRDRLRFETTLLPSTRTIEWDGRPVATVVSQLVAYTNGAVAEVARDFYAQADDGSVWHFGEDVANYEDGVLVDREGSWLAGQNGRPAMVMPATPRIGDVYSAGNRRGQGPDEVTVRSTGQTVDGPRGQVAGALLIQESAVDGTVEDKTFAPGYGEFHARISSQDELYNVALAWPTDAVAGAVPEELSIVSRRADRILASRRTGLARTDRPGDLDWMEVNSSVDAMTEAWNHYGSSQGPGILVSQMSDRLADLVAAVAARRPVRIQRAAIEVAQASLDLQLRHRLPADVDRDRLRLSAGQVLVDVAVEDLAALDGDVVVLDALWARVGQPKRPGDAQVGAALDELRAAVVSKNLSAAAVAAVVLREIAT